MVTLKKIDIVQGVYFVFLQQTPVGLTVLWITWWFN